MPTPAARYHQVLWLVLAVSVLLVFPRAGVLAQDEPTPIPAQSSVVDASGTLKSQATVLEIPSAAPDVCPQSAQDVLPPYYDYLILLDVSRSMRGVRGVDDEEYYPALDIWDEVAQSATQFVSELPDEAAVYIVPFAGGVLDIGTGKLVDPTDPAYAPEPAGLFDPYYMNEPAARQAAINSINSLYPDYEQTHLARSVEYALRLSASLKADDADQREHVQTLLIYSDGLGNGPGDPEYLGDDASSFPTLPEILRQYLDEENYLFTKYIMLSEAANGLSPSLVDELIGVGVSIVNGEVPKIRELRLSVSPGQLGTLDVDDRAQVKLCLASGDPGGGVELRLSDASQLPEDVTLRFIPPDSAVIRGDQAGIEAGWRLVEKPAAPVDQTYLATLVVDPVDPEIIPVPGQFQLPFRIQGFPDAAITVAAPDPVQARRSDAAGGGGVAREALISLGAALPEGASVTLRLSSDDAHHGMESGFSKRPGDYGDALSRELTLGPGDDGGYLRIDLPHDSLVITPDGAPRQDGPYALEFTVEAEAQGLRMAGVEPGNPVTLPVRQEIVVVPGGSLTGCQAAETGEGETVAEAPGGATPACPTVAFNLGGSQPGVRAEHDLRAALSSGAGVELRIGNRDGRDLFPNARAGFAEPRGEFDQPAPQPTAALDAASGPLAVVLDVPADDLLGLEPGIYPVTIDVVVDPAGADLDLVGARPNGDGTWSLSAGAVVKVAARPVIEIGPVPPAVSAPPEFVIGEAPDQPVRWKVDVPYTTEEGVTGTILRLDSSGLPPGVTAVLMGGMRERTEVLLDKPGLSIGLQASADSAALETLGSGQHAMRVFLVIDPGNAEVTGQGVLDNGDGSYALPVDLVTTLIDPGIVRCDLPSFDTLELPDKGPSERVVWNGSVSCAMPEGAIVRVGSEIGEGAPVGGDAGTEPRKLDVAIEDASVTVSAGADDLRARGLGTVCLPVVVSLKLEGVGLILEGDGIQRTGEGMYAGSVEACAEIGAAAIVRVDAPECEVPALRSDADPAGAFRVICTISHAEKNGGQAVLTIARGGLSQGLEVTFAGGKESVTIREGTPSPLVIEITGRNEAALAEGASLDFELVIDPVDSVLEGSASAWRTGPAGGSGGIRAQTEPADDAVTVEVDVPDVPVIEPPTCAFTEPAWTEGRTTLDLTTDDDVPNPAFVLSLDVAAGAGGACPLAIEVGGDLDGVAARFPGGESSIVIDGPGSYEIPIELPDQIRPGAYPVPVTLTLDPGEGEMRASTAGSAGSAGPDGVVVWSSTLQIAVKEATARVRISGDGSATRKIEKYGDGDKVLEWPTITVELNEKDAAAGRSVLVEWTCTRFEGSGVSPDCAGAQGGNYAATLDGENRSVEIPFRAGEAPFRAFAEGEYPAKLLVDLDSGGAAILVEGVENADLRGEHATITFLPRARVYVSFLNRFGRNLLLALLGLGLLGLLLFARPGLPGDAAILHAGGTSVIGHGETIGPSAADIGTSNDVGTLKGRWFGRQTGNAVLQPYQEVEINGESFPSGGKVPLNVGDTVVVPEEGVSFEYTRQEPDGGDDGDGDGGYDGSY